MLHILLLILKIIGIILLAVLCLVLLILIVPVTYAAKVEVKNNRASYRIRSGWLFRIVYFGVHGLNTDIKGTIRLFGIPIKRFGKEKKSKPKREKKKKLKKQSEEFDSNLMKNNTTEEFEKDADSKEKESFTETLMQHVKKASDSLQEGTEKNIDFSKKEETLNSSQEATKEETDSLKKGTEEDADYSQEATEKDTDFNSENTANDNQAESGYEKKQSKIKSFFEKIKNILIGIKNKIIQITENVEGIHNKTKELKKFITAKSTKRAYQYGKKLVIKLLRHLRPRKIRADITFGFEQPDETGKTLGYLGMAYSVFHINPKRIRITPDFEHKMIDGRIVIKGHLILGLVLIYCLKFYFNKDIHRIIKKYN